MVRYGRAEREKGGEERYEEHEREREMSRDSTIFLIIFATFVETWVVIGLKYKCIRLLYKCLSNVLMY